MGHPNWRERPHEEASLVLQSFHGVFLESIDLNAAGGKAMEVLYHFRPFTRFTPSLFGLRSLQDGAFLGTAEETSLYRRALRPELVVERRLTPQLHAMEVEGSSLDLEKVLGLKRQPAKDNDSAMYTTRTDPFCWDKPDLPVQWKVSKNHGRRHVPLLIGWIGLRYHVAFVPTSDLTLSWLVWTSTCERSCVSEGQG